MKTSERGLDHGDLGGWADGRNFAAGEDRQAYIYACTPNPSGRCRPLCIDSRPIPGVVRS